MKKLVFITGTRADFGKIKTLIKTIQNSDRFEAHVFATGMHMLKKYGLTINEVYKSEIKNIFPFLNQDDVSGSQMDYILANTIDGFGRYIRENKPDMIIVHGDRVESLSAAIVGALNNIPVSHIEGGELSGTIDEHIRHAISKLSHIHFTSNLNASNRLIQMGENKDSVYLIGSPEIDIMLSKGLPDLTETLSYYDISFKKYSILLYHSVTTESDNIIKNSKCVVDAAIESGEKFIVLYPNNDMGSSYIFDEYRRFEDNANFKLLPSIRFEGFLTILKNANMIIGNSSSGVREAPVYGVPTINIGSRQHNRSHHESIINVDEGSDSILKAIQEHMCEKKYSKASIFGDGKSSEKFLKIISDDAFWNVSIQKVFNTL
jgi:UDP-N-acetylglucosamine 2-epimerase (hydrolysing)